MNRRAQRRLRQKQQKATPVLIVGDNIAATAVGDYYEGKARQNALGDKVPGKHRWVAMATWSLASMDPKGFLDADTLKFLDHENLTNLTIGCWDCETPLGDGTRGTIKHDSVCPAGAS